MDLNQVLLQLGKAGISHVLVEGGSRIMTRFIENRLADKIIIVLAPRLIGGSEAPTFFEGQGAADMKQALQLKSLHTFNLEEDIFMEGYF